MKYPTIINGFSLDCEVPQNYRDLAAKIDEQFMTGLKNYSKLILNDFGIKYDFPSFQWDSERGLHSICIGEGRGAYLNVNGEGGKTKFLFKNIDTEMQAIAVLNIISTYFNRLQEYKTK